MKKIFDAVVVTGKYTKDGQEKNRYLTVGAVFQNDKGQSSLKLEAIPVSGFNGWINFYEPKSQTDAPRKEAPTATQADAGDFSDDVPF